mmetsp:Transcript_15365/g.46124  ORF Transcript_15365/g.46124 Transcript_15365/m.46124 type:complete len:216 (-) Transcript_15365:35-682(-)
MRRLTEAWARLGWFTDLRSRKNNAEECLRVCPPTTGHGRVRSGWRHRFQPLPPRQVHPAKECGGHCSETCPPRLVRRSPLAGLCKPLFPPALDWGARMRVPPPGTGSGRASRALHVVPSPCMSCKRAKLLRRPSSCLLCATTSRRTHRSRTGAQGPQPFFGMAMHVQLEGIDRRLKHHYVPSWRSAWPHVCSIHNYLSPLSLYMSSHRRSWIQMI